MQVVEGISDLKVCKCLRVKQKVRGLGDNRVVRKCQEEGPAVVRSHKGSGPGGMSHLLVLAQVWGPADSGSVGRREACATLVKTKQRVRDAA